MRDIVRTLLLFAIGAVDLTEDKVRGIVEELVRRGEFSVDEAREVTSQWAAEVAARRGGLDTRIRTALDEALGQANVASHESIVELQARVTALEEALARLAAPSPGP